jgi:DNA-3-methyladenine glycosylase II
VWPRGDLALATAAVEIGVAIDRPSDVELEAIAQRGAPRRAVAARILWHHYLRTRNLPV